MIFIKRVPLWVMPLFLLLACQPQTTPALPESPPEHLVATNVRIDLSVDNIGSAAEDISGCVRQMDGYIAQASTPGEGTDEVTMDLRLPSTSYTDALDKCIKPSRDVASIYVWSQDITAQYAVLHHQLKQLEAQASREPWNKSWETERQIEFIRAKMAYRLERAAYATITVHIKPH